MTDDPPSRRFQVIAAALLAAHGMLAWINRVLILGEGRDEANYITLARSLRMLRYEDYFLVGSPAHSQYPPLFPGFVALLSLPFGEHGTLLVAIDIVCSMLALLVLCDLVRRVSGPVTALLVLALSAFNPGTLYAAGHVLSEPLYMLLAVVAVRALTLETPAAANPQETSSRPARAPFVAVGSAVAAALTRTVGVTLLGTVFIHWLMDRRYRRVIVLALVGALTVGSWLAWTVAAPNKIAGRSYVADAAFEQGASGPVATILNRVRGNVSTYVVEHLPRALPVPSLAPLVKRVPGGASMSGLVVALDAAVAICVILLGGIGAYVLFRDARPAMLYLILYAGLLAIWTWHLSRFLYPILPFLFWAMVEGARVLAARRRWLRPLPALVAGGIVIMALGRIARASADTLRCDREEVATSPACVSEIERGWLAAIKFIRTSTPPSAIVMTTTDAQLGLLTNRRALFTGFVPARTGEELIRYLRSSGTDYVLLTPIRPPLEQKVALLSEACARLRVVREFAPITLVLEVAEPGTTEGGDACAAIRRYATSGIVSNLW